MSLRNLLILFCALTSCISKKGLLEKAETGDKAEALAAEVYSATNADCWDSVAVASWTFAGYEHRWDRIKNVDVIKKKEQVIEVNLDNPSEGIVTEDGKIVTGKDKKKALEKGYSRWANDSYWFNPFPKFYDDGVERLYYRDKKNQEHLVIKYNKGDEIGDIYDWTIGQNKLPIKWNLFVDIIPFNNVGVSWENWKETDCGLQIATLHKAFIFSLPIEKVSVILKDDYEE